MSHLHLPDGILPWWLWLGGMVVMAVGVMLGLRRLQQQRHMLPGVAILAAVALVAVNIPLGLPIHVNLAALSGIILGPGFGFLAVFVVNLFNTLVGHGGITMLGLNVLIVGSEAVVAGLVFGSLGGQRRLLRNAGLAVVVALSVSTLLLLAVVGAGGLNVDTLAHGLHDHGHHHHHGEAVTGGFLTTFATIIAPLVGLWIGVELVVTLLIVSYVRKVRGHWFEGGVK